MNKKVSGVLLLSLISLAIISLSINFVLAADAASAATTAGEISKGTIGVVSEIFKPILGPLFGDTELLTRVFLAALLFMLLYSIIITIFKDKKALSLIVSGLVTAISLLALPSNFLQAITLQYGAMGAALLAAIPFVILLVFTVKVGSMVVARITWVFYALYFLALTIYKIATTTMGAFSAESIPYWGAMIAGILIFIFIIPIRRFFTKEELKELKEEGMNVIEREKLLNKYEKQRLEGLKT